MNKMRFDTRNVKKIARICHEVNRSYCIFLGDESQPAWEDAPEWQKKSAIDGVRSHLTSGLTMTPQGSHEAWMSKKLLDGWVYGDEKDPLKKTHPCIVPYDQLPAEQRAKDYLFIGVVHSLVTQPWFKA